MTYVMKPGDKPSDPPVVVLEANAEGEMVKKEDTAAFEACEEEWKTLNIEAIKEGKKLEGDGADDAAAEIFEEVIQLEKEKAELAALSPPDEQGPDPPLNETDKIILAAFADLLSTVSEVAAEWRGKFEEKKEPIIKFIDMLSLPPQDDGLDEFMKRGLHGSVTGKRHSVTDSKVLKARERENSKKGDVGKKKSNKHYVFYKHLKQKKSTFMAGLEHQKSFNKIDANNLSSLFNEFLDN